MYLPLALLGASLIVNRGIAAQRAVAQCELNDLQRRHVSKWERYALRVYKVHLADGNIVVFTCLRSDMWKVVVLNRNAKFEERKSWAVVDEKHIFDENATTIVSIEEDENIIELTPVVSGSQKRVQVRIHKKQFAVDFVDADSGVAFQRNWNFSVGKQSVDSKVSVQFDKSSHVYGLGEKSGLAINKKGNKYVMWNFDHFGYMENGDPLYQSIPFVLLTNPPTSSSTSNLQQFHSVFIDNVGRQEWDLTAENCISVKSNADPCRIYISLGNSIADLVTNYTCLTGKSDLPPLYAFGYHQCRWSYETEERVKKVASTLREKDIPCDVIYLDIDYMQRFKCFTWNNTTFPDPHKLVEWLKERNFKVVVIIDPGIKIENGYDVYEDGIKGDHFVKRHERTKQSDATELKPYVNSCWAGESYFPDFTSARTREWWGTLYKGLLEVGISGFWNDMNEPACFNTQAGYEYKTFHSDVIHDCDGQEEIHDKCHNIYGMQMAKGSYEGLLKLKPNERPLVVTRSGYAGIQRYAWTWTGDNTSNFAHLAMSIPMLLNMGMTGQPFTGADVGGFCENSNEELYARWISFASVAYPFCRSHTTEKTIDQEPYSFGERVEKISRKYIQLRYRLMPYMYTWARHSSVTGQPMLRSLFYEYPNVPACYESKYASTQLFVGPDLLVCPVIYANATSRSLYLPPGKWYSFYDKQEYTGDQVITVDAPWEVVPLFVRENTLLPMRKNHSESVYINLSEELIFEFFGKNRDEARETFVYLDDGISKRYQTDKEYGLYKVSPKAELTLIEGKGFATSISPQ